MGCCSSIPVDPEMREADRVIQRELKRDQRDQESEIKLLLLGAGESGKSTIFKQMKILHHDGFKPKECLQYKQIIHANVLQSMRVLIAASQKLAVDFDDPVSQEYAEKLMSYRDNQIIQNIAEIMTPNTGAMIAHLWKDSAIQETFRKRNTFQLNDSAEYYFNDIERICLPNYIPTQQDVLRSRVKTVGITEEEFAISGHKFRMFDVGGQRTERRKWIHVFDDVTAIIFVTSLSEFDQKLMEDSTTNRMQESLNLFDEICNHRQFVETPIVVFFNKTDLFERKVVDGADLGEYFPEYKGGCDIEAGKQFIEQLFLNRDRKGSSKRKIYTYFTCATDSRNVETVFNTTKDIILRRALDDANLGY